MIVFDTETSGLVEPEAVPLNKQPYIIEFGAIKLDDDLEIIDKIHFLAKPPIPISDEITEITGIKNGDLENEKPFAAYYTRLVQFFIGEGELVAHNLPFDRSMLSFELRRLDRLIMFPWPYIHICTVEATKDINNKWLKQEELYELATGKKANQTHRALDDVLQLVEIIHWMRGKDLI